MSWRDDDVLSVLDTCCDDFTFPMLDNGYVYLAATRMSLYRSAQDWAMVIEVFGFSPRAGLPDTHVYTFASHVRRTRNAEQYVSQAAYDAHVKNNPHNESVFVFPIQPGGWQSAENCELLAEGQHSVHVRDTIVQVPALAAYAAHEITLGEPNAARVFELCRLLAATQRERVLATPQERRQCVPPELEQVLQLEEWHHPDVVTNERPSSSAFFRAMASILVGAETSTYRPSLPANTHWQHWPGGGSL